MKKFILLLIFTANLSVVCFAGVDWRGGHNNDFNQNNNFNPASSPAGGDILIDPNTYPSNPMPVLSTTCSFTPNTILIQKAATFSISAAGSLTVTTSITMGDGSITGDVFTVNGSLTVGSITIKKGATLTLGAGSTLNVTSITILTGGTLNVNGTINITGSITNSGTIASTDATNGSINFNGNTTLTNSSTATIPNPTIAQITAELLPQTRGILILMELRYKQFEALPHHKHFII